MLSLHASLNQLQQGADHVQMQHQLRDRSNSCWRNEDLSIVFKLNYIFWKLQMTKICNIDSEERPRITKSFSPVDLTITNLNRSLENHSFPQSLWSDGAILQGATWHNQTDWSQKESTRMNVDDGDCFMWFSFQQNSRHQNMWSCAWLPSAISFPSATSVESWYCLVKDNNISVI